MKTDKDVVYIWSDVIMPHELHKEFPIGSIVRVTGARSQYYEQSATVVGYRNTPARVKLELRSNNSRIELSASSLQLEKMSDDKADEVIAIMAIDTRDNECFVENIATGCFLNDKNGLFYEEVLNFLHESVEEHIVNTDKMKNWKIFAVLENGVTVPLNINISISIGEFSA